jgi:predicted aspartyl protease
MPTRHTIDPRRLLPLLCLGFLLAPTPGAAARQAPVEAVPAVLTLPFELGSNKIYMQTKVNADGPYPFVLDTGAPFTVLDWSLADTLGIHVQSAGTIGGAGVGTTRLGVASGVRLSLDGLRFQPRRLEVISLNDTLSQAEGRDVQGLLGGDILSRFVCDFDFNAGELRLHAPRTFAYTGAATRLPLSIEGHVLAKATVRMAGREPITGRFIIDTGARIAVSLNTHVVAENRLLAEDIPHIRTTIGWGIGGPLEHGLARAESLELGGVTFAAPTVTLSSDARGAFANRRLTGIIGNEVLKRCRVYIDYSREEMYLEPSESVATPFPADASGLFITAGGAEHRVYTVRTVVEGSPAAEAGIKPGDVIDRIGGGIADRYSLEELRTLLLTPDKTHELEVVRDGARLAISVKTRRLI